MRTYLDSYFPWTLWGYGGMRFHNTAMFLDYYRACDTPKAEWA